MNQEAYLTQVQQIVMRYLENEPYQVFLFGSRAVGNHRPQSDIDVGVWGKQALPALLKADIEQALEDSPIPCRVDVVDFSKVSEMFRQQALSHIQVWQQAE